MLFSVKQINSFIHSLYTLGRIRLAESAKWTVTQEARECSNSVYVFVYIVT